MKINVWRLSPRRLVLLIQEKRLQDEIDFRGCSLQEVREKLHDYLNPDEPPSSLRKARRGRARVWPRRGTQKNLIVASVREEWTTDWEVAEITGVPLEIVRARLYEAKKRKRLEFRKLLQYRQPPQ